MYISKEELYDILGLSFESDTPKTVITRSTEGPGEYDFWGRFEGRSDNYLQTSYASLRKPRKKIILSHVPIVDEFYVGLFTALLRDENCELTVWTGKEFVAITNLQELSDAFKVIREESATTLQDFLQQQQHDSAFSGNAVFLDAWRYDANRHKKKGDFHTTESGQPNHNSANTRG